jgi:hypothetical protein
LSSIATGFTWVYCYIQAVLALLGITGRRVDEFGIRPARRVSRHANRAL